jgi:hypothetical protein
MSKYTVEFQINAPLATSAEALGINIEDLIVTAVAPALWAQVVPLSFTIKKARR